MKFQTTNWKAYTALPAYAGGKRKLLQWIFHEVGQILPRFTWSKLTLADSFSGSGMVSFHAKAHGFRQIYCNDWSDRSQHILHGLLANTNTRLTCELADFLLTPVAEPGYIASLTGEVFTHRHATVLDTISQNTERLSCPVGRHLAHLWLWHLVERFVGFVSTIGTSNRPLANVAEANTPWWELNPKRLTDQSLKKLLKPIGPILEKERQNINRGIFAGLGPVIPSQKDALSFVKGIQADILYADPPYPGTLAYETHYKTLDAILRGGPPLIKPDA